MKAPNRSNFKKRLVRHLKTWENCQVQAKLAEEIIQMFEKTFPHLENEWKHKPRWSQMSQEMSRLIKQKVKEEDEKRKKDLIERLEWERKFRL